MCSCSCFDPTSSLGLVVDSVSVSSPKYKVRFLCVADPLLVSEKGRASGTPVCEQTNKARMNVEGLNTIV